MFEKCRVCMFEMPKKAWFKYHSDIPTGTSRICESLETISGDHVLIELFLSPSKLQFHTITAMYESWLQIFYFSLYEIIFETIMKRFYSFIS